MLSGVKYLLVEQEEMTALALYDTCKK